MRDLYLPKETIAKGIAILVCSIATLMKLFGYELTQDITETEVYTAVLAIIDAVVVLYYGVFKNFVTSVENDTHTKQMRFDKELKHYFKPEEEENG